MYEATQSVCVCLNRLFSTKALLQVSSLLWWSQTGTRRCCHSPHEVKSSDLYEGERTTAATCNTTVALGLLCKSHPHPHTAHRAAPCTSTLGWSNVCLVLQTSKKSMLSICSGSLRSGHGPVYIKSRPITAPHRGSELTAKVWPKEQKMKSGGGGGANVKLIFLRFLGLVQIWLRPAALHSQAPAQSPRGGSRLRESRRSQVAGRRTQHLSASSGEFRESPAPAAQLRE